MNGGNILVQKSRTGKKKRNPYQGQAAKAEQAKNGTNSAAEANKKTTRIWMMVAILYLIGVLFAGQFPIGSSAYRAINIICNFGIVAVGVYMIIATHLADKKGQVTSSMNTMFGFVMIVMGIMQAITFLK